jgi:hypothetical protein
MVCISFRDQPRCLDGVGGFCAVARFQTGRVVLVTVDLRLPTPPKWWHSPARPVS